MHFKVNAIWICLVSGLALIVALGLSLQRRRELPSYGLIHAMAAGGEGEGLVNESLARAFLPEVTARNLKTRPSREEYTDVKSSEWECDQCFKTTITPAWPGTPYQLACPLETKAETCRLLGAREHACFEPERDTEEILSSFLLSCPNCLYVDIGCNIGYFAAHAAVLGASVECYEPTLNYVHAVRATRRFNRIDEDRLKVYHRAVVEDRYYHTEPKMFNKAYMPCGVAMKSSHTGKQWPVSLVSIKHILSHRHVAFLKMDIDKNEGGLFHDVVDMIKANETSVETILIEAGDMAGDVTIGRFYEWSCGKSKKCKEPSNPRGGQFSDFLDLQRSYNYDIYRVNIHVGREIFNWVGTNVNKNMMPQRDGVLPMFFVRSIKKLEKVLPSITEEQFRNLFRFGTSFLVTRVQLAEKASHSTWDMQFAGMSDQAELNRGNPAVRP